MFLQTLHIENFRSLSDLILDFRQPDGSTRQWTLLLGENGCGKSSVLRAIALLMAGADSLAELLGTPDPWVRNNCKFARLSASLVTQKGETREIALTIRRGQTITQLLMENAAGLEPLTSALGHADSNYPVIGYGASRRLSSGRARSRADDGYFNTPRANALATLFTPDAPLNPLDTWAMDLHYREKQKGLSIVKDALSELLPGMTFKGIDRAAGALLFDTPDGPVPLQQLSDGYQNMAGWCGDLLFRLVSTFGHRRQPLHARGLLLLDEMDLHLHPVWQKQLKAFLTAKLPKFQVIATTHSPLTAQQSGEGEIITLQRDDAALVTASHFAGAATQLTVQQLMTSAAFGLESTLSAEMQSARGEWKTSRTSASKAKLATLVRPTLIPPDSESRSLLARVEQMLNARSPSASDALGPGADKSPGSAPGRARKRSAAPAAQSEVKPSKQSPSAGTSNRRKRP